MLVRHPDLGGRDPSPDALPALLEGVHAWILGTTPVDDALLVAHPDLLVIARRGVGYEAIDVEAARARRRVVTIAAGGNGPSVADHALAFMLAVSKQVVTLTGGMRGGDWDFYPGARAAREDGWDHWARACGAAGGPAPAWFRLPGACQRDCP